MGHGCEGWAVGGMALMLLLVVPPAAAAHAVGGLFVVGDSYGDTGNFDPLNATFNTPWRPPYGSTWPGRPAGRFSDGKVLTDFYASYLGLPSPLPYRLFTGNIKSKGLFKCGINFAFGGSGIFPTFGPQYPTIDAQILELQGVIEEGLHYSKRFLASSYVLFVVAGNDYIAYDLQHSDGDSNTEFIKLVVNGMSSSLLTLYKLGFRHFAVTTLPPFGCFPVNTESTNYTNCDAIKSWRSSYHNKLLKESLSELGRETKAHFTQLDLESAFNRVLHEVNERTRLNWRPCCEGLGTASCGDRDSKLNPLYSLCSSPNQYFFWDDGHPTNIGWKLVSQVLLSS